MTDTEKPSYTIEVIPGTRIALFHWVGPITLDDRRTNRDVIVDFCDENDIHDVIIDGRDQDSKTSVMESFNFGTEVPGGFRGFRLAVVHRPDDESLQFIEAVAGNRGSSTKSFVDIDEARAWLEATERNADDQNDHD